VCRCGEARIACPSYAHLPILNPPFLCCRVDSPQIGHPPDPDKSVALRTVLGEELSYMTARPSPPKNCHFEDLSGIRVSILRTSNCTNRTDTNTYWGRGVWIGVEAVGVHLNADDRSSVVVGTLQQALQFPFLQGLFQVVQYAQALRKESLLLRDVLLQITGLS
jgi:hypothetical protein